MIKERDGHGDGRAHDTAEHDGVLRIHGQSHERHSEEISSERGHAVDESSQEPDDIDVESSKHGSDPPRYCGILLVLEYNGLFCKGRMRRVRLRSDQKRLRPAPDIGRRTDLFSLLTNLFIFNMFQQQQSKARISLLHNKLQHFSHMTPFCIFCLLYLIPR